jgi:hypothetical protein
MPSGIKKFRRTKSSDVLGIQGELVRSVTAEAAFTEMRYITQPVSRNNARPEDADRPSRLLSVQIADAYGLACFGRQLE